ncbi:MULTISPECIES: hypothetical protein [unclassified Streptomyces]|uniref:hypothetical protein n=1 Tax=unclassified Streptomyces TaxID=2593676 RepID=UPI0022569DF2|nr:MULTISPECIES: hypothetical protein [unclassified Streptomyces]MCX4988571.1 hypothetical protein [Streptomyces sp. NBC_00568]MCX5006208.1 hypothetical protein [Streptomyces sp. NBC_00638]
MNTELLVATLSGIVALVSAAYSTQANRKNSLLANDLERQKVEHRRALERQDVMSRFRDPLLWAAFDFQSRLFNIVNGYFLRIHFTESRDRQYAIRSTLHVLAEYLGWVEILRHRIYFLDLGNKEANRQLVALSTRIGAVLNSDGYPDRHFQLFRSDQRAIGELVIADDKDHCMGYAEFCTRLESDPEFADWFARLSASVTELASIPGRHPRLVDLQVALMDLIDFLDPEQERFPQKRRFRTTTEGQLY